MNENRPDSQQPIEPSSEFARAVVLHLAYWTHNPAEHARLLARGLEFLDWPERLRLHHLNCLQRLGRDAESASTIDECQQTLRCLAAADSPYLPRRALIWQGQTGQSGPAEPDLQGDLLNPSITHLGCLEIYRTDVANQAVSVGFVSFAELSGILFAPPSLIRAAKLFYENGRDELVLAPMLYGPTWKIGDEFDRAGEMTKFVAHLDSPEVDALGASGIGVGQQDLLVRNQAGEGNLFGLGSVFEISFPLDMRDPQFDQKARARGIDPDELRRRVE
jgi:hypothetical protein